MTICLKARRLHREAGGRSIAQTRDQVLSGINKYSVLDSSKCLEEIIRTRNEMLRQQLKSCIGWSWKTPLGRSFLNKDLKEVREAAPQ